MNWIDAILIVTAGSGLFLGWRIGFLGAIFIALGTYIGMILAGQLADKVAEALTDSVPSDTLATALAYAFIFGASLTTAFIARGIVKKILNLVFLGWVDLLGSLALGLVSGMLLASAVLTFTVRYSQDLPNKGGVGFIIEMTGVQEALNGALVESALVPVFLDTLDAFPADSLGMIPDDFKTALGLLKHQIDS
jgi:hypothetical protein